jgi:hypothetical protein
LALFVGIASFLGWSGVRPWPFTARLEELIGFAETQR